MLSALRQPEQAQNYGVLPFDPVGAVLCQRAGAVWVCHDQLGVDGCGAGAQRYTLFLRDPAGDLYAAGAGGGDHSVAYSNRLLEAHRTLVDAGFDGAADRGAGSGYRSRGERQ